MKKRFLIVLMMITVVSDFIFATQYISETENDNLQIVQTLDNKEFIFFLSNNKINCINPEGETILLYNGQEKELIDYTVFTDVFDFSILIKEKEDNNYILKSFIFNNDLLEINNNDVYLSGNVIENEKIVNKQNGYEYYWMSDSALYYSTSDIDKTDLNVNLIAENVKEYSVKRNFNNVLGYFITVDNELYFFSDAYENKSPCFAVNDVLSIEELETQIDRENNTDYLIRTSKGFELFRINNMTCSVISEELLFESQIQTTIKEFSLLSNENEYICLFTDSDFLNCKIKNRKFEKIIQLTPSVYEYWFYQQDEYVFNLLYKDDNNFVSLLMIDCNTGSTNIIDSIQLNNQKMFFDFGFLNELPSVLLFDDEKLRVYEINNNSFNFIVQSKIENLNINDRKISELFFENSEDFYIFYENTNCFSKVKEGILMDIPFEKLIRSDRVNNVLYLIYTFNNYIYIEKLEEVAK